MIKIGWWGHLWNLAYIWKTPWDIGGPRPELVRLVENNELKPGRAIDLGCGVGDNTIYLAQQGFEVSGFDISTRAVSKAKRKAQELGVSANFFVADVTKLSWLNEDFNLIFDNGCFHSLWGNRSRKDYVKTVLSLTKPGSTYFLRCFVKDSHSHLSLGLVDRGEVERRFSGDFTIEYLEPLPPGVGIEVVYLMIRKDSSNHIVK